VTEMGFGHEFNYDHLSLAENCTSVFSGEAGIQLFGEVPIFLTIRLYENAFPIH
jgi:hypothetical protein